MSKKYKIGIYTPNKIFVVKGKVVRSPFEAEISEKELNSFKMKIKTDGIDKYSIEEISMINPEIKQFVNNPTVQDEDISNKENIISATEIKIEELETKSKSLLEKFISS